MPEGTPLTTNKDEEPTFLSTLMADGLRRRKFSPSVSNNGNGPVFDKTSIPTRNVVNTAPTKGILQNWNTFRTKIRKIMYDIVFAEHGFYCHFSNSRSTIKTSYNVNRFTKDGD